MNAVTQVAIISINVLWLMILSFAVWKLYSRFSFLMRDSDKKSVPAVLEDLLREQHVVKKDVTSLLARMDTNEEQMLKHIRKVGLVRFNPFHDTGGEQSFILALLDSKDSGVIISGLYARSGMRWYAKTVKEGKGKDHELSEEEDRAVKNAK